MAEVTSWARIDGLHKNAHKSGNRRPALPAVTPPHPLWPTSLLSAPRRVAPPAVFIAVWACHSPFSSKLRLGGIMSQLHSEHPCTAPDMEGSHESKHGE
jgi:hypothetical protein